MMHVRGLIGGAVLAIACMGQPAQAQDVGKIEKRVGALEGQMKAVQRKVFPGGDARYFEPEVGGQQPGDTTPLPNAAGNPLGDLQSRVDALEKQLAILTGQVEEAGFKANQVEEAMTRLREDYDFRLQQLEARGQPGGAAALMPGTPPTAAPNSTFPAAPVPRPTPPNPLATPTASPTAAAPKAAANPIRQEYDAAYAFVFQQQYDKAEPALLAFLNKYPNSPEASNAAFWLGRTYFNRKLYAQAAKAYLDGYRRYPKGEKGPDSLLGLGESMVALGKPDEACQAYNELQAVYPSASAAIKKRTADARAKAKCS